METELYNEYLSVNAAALEKLMELYSDRLTPYINRYVRNIHDAEDLMIDVFAYLVCKKPHIKDSFNSYMYKAARNRALSFLRKSKRIVFFGGQKNRFLHRGQDSYKRA